jgi:hypothetical protein
VEKFTGNLIQATELFLKELDSPLEVQMKVRFKESTPVEFTEGQKTSFAKQW